MNNGSRQTGFSMVAIVMVLLTIGLLIMTSLNRQLSAQIRIDSEERRYLRFYNQAASSLNWGLKQAWPQPQENWHCQQHPVFQFEACIKTLANSENILLKGQGSISDENVGEQKGMALYLLTSLQPLTIGDDSGNYFNLVKLSAGWLDFCPANKC